MDAGLCEFCGNDIPFELEQCPHCGRSGPPPNVKAVQAEEERQALDRRYREALQEAELRGCREIVEGFEAVTRQSKAVVNCRFAEADRLASSDRQLLGTYYQRLEAELQAPYGNAWDRWRQITDATLFPLYFRRIQFAALTLDGIGVQSYGECSLVLKEALIADRTSVFEDNSAVFLRDRDFKLLPGHRATWSERSKLCVAKLAAQIDGTAKPSDFPGLLLRQGATPEEDRFVEVHVWGALTIRAVERALLSSAARKAGQVIRRAFRARLLAWGVALEVD